MKFLEFGSWAVLAAVASARCFRPPITSAVSSVAASSSSIPSSEIPASSSVVSSPVVSSAVASSSVPSSSVISSSIVSSSTPVSSSSTVVETCGGYQCFAAITAEPTIGDSFCSSWLSQTPETTVVTETAVVTSTATSLETITTLLTQTTATTTKIVGSTTRFLKKRVVASSVVPSIVSSAPAPSETILSQCASNDERVSSACSCYLSTTSTVTVTETSTSTVVAEVASTVIETSTTKVVATVEAMATQTVPAQPVLNPAFEGYLSTGNISPWSTGGEGQIQVINGVNPCMNNNGVVQCVGGQVVIRPYPPAGGLKYSSISQLFLAKPSSTYGLSFVYRCLNYDGGSKIEVWYNGQFKGSTNNCINSSAFQRPNSPIQFTTDAAGRGTLEIRFVSSGSTPYLYYYADDFQATLI